MKKTVAAILVFLGALVVQAASAEPALLDYHCRGHQDRLLL